MSAPRVLALNGSPRGGAGATSKLLGPLLAGMRDAGAETELIRVRDLKLEPCIGCYSCWVQTPGRCIHLDGMESALEAWSRADLVVIGTPVYHGSMTGMMKTFLDRLLPRYEPWLVPSPHVEGASGHPARGSEPSRMVLVSACGFPGLHNFDALVYTFRHIARMHGMTMVAEVLRPFAEPLRLRALKGLFAEYFEALERAGREIITSGEIAEPTRTELERDLMPGSLLQQHEMANEHWRRLRSQALLSEDRLHGVGRGEAEVVPDRVPE
jgi:multimeric flavodoxin WrbA